MVVRLDVLCACSVCRRGLRRCVGRDHLDRGGIRYVGVAGAGSGERGDLRSARWASEPNACSV